MSDIHPTDNDFTHLSHDMASAEATHASYDNSASIHPPTTIDPPRIQQLVVTDELLQLIPSLSGNDFFAAPDDPELDSRWRAPRWYVR
jgi:hypothetical protein